MRGVLRARLEKEREAWGERVGDGEQTAYLGVLVLKLELALFYIDIE